MGPSPGTGVIVQLWVVLDRMTSLAQRVAGRFSLTILSDDRFRPPKWLLQGVDTGEIPAKGLLVWKYVVESLGPKFNYGAATVYWRNKAKKEGLELLPKHLQSGEGAEFGPFKIKTGDQIEDWVKERLRSEGLYQEGVKTAADWQLEVGHLQRMLEDAQKRIAQHEKGLAEGSRVNQRTKWLAEAKADLAKAEKEMTKAQAALTEFKTEVVRHEEAKAPVIDFEKQFQAAMMAATMDLSKREVLVQAKAALAKFEQEMMGQAKMAAEKEAGILDSLWGAVERAWNWVVSAFEDFRDWISDLSSDTKRISKLLDAAGA